MLGSPSMGDARAVLPRYEPLDLPNPGDTRRSFQGLGTVA